MQAPQFIQALTPLFVRRSTPKQTTKMHVYEGKSRSGRDISELTDLEDITVKGGNQYKGAVINPQEVREGAGGIERSETAPRRRPSRNNSQLTQHVRPSPRRAQRRRARQMRPRIPLRGRGGGGNHSLPKESAGTDDREDPGACSLVRMALLSQ